MKNTKRILLFVFILILSKEKHCYGQFSFEKQRQIDSLNAIINSPSSHDTSTISAYVELSEILCISNVDTMKYLCEKAKVIAEKALSTESPKGITKKLQISLADALNNIGYVYERQGAIEEALEYYLRSLKIRKKIGDKKGTSYSLNNIGYIYNSRGDIPRALEYYHKSLKIQKEIGDKVGVATSLNNIGMVYYDQGDVSNAMGYFHNILKIREEIGDEKSIAGSLNNIGYIYYYQANTVSLDSCSFRDKLFSQALHYYNKSLEIRKKIKFRQGIAESLHNIGHVYQRQAKVISSNNSIRRRKLLNQAKEYYYNSLRLYEEIRNKEGIVYSLNSIGSIDIEVGGNVEASVKKRFVRALSLAKEIGFPSLITVSSKNLSEIAKRQGRYAEALEMYKLHIQMRDSIKNEANQKAAIQQQTKYEYEKQKALDKVETDKIIALEKKEREKQQVLTYAAGGGFILVFSFFLFVFNRLRITKKQKMVIEKQKEEVQLAHKETQQQKEVIEEAHKEITDSINYAERIQRSFLATTELLNENLQEYFVFFQPKDVVSGDFYWAGTLSNGTFAMVNADSTGHGVPGAIMSILNVSSIEKAIEKGVTTPWDIFNDTRKTIIERLKKDGTEEGGKDGMDASIICFDFDNLKMTYCAAQNPIWIIRNGEVIRIKPEKMPIGKHYYDNIPFVGGEFQLQKGDQVYTLTDGFQDQFGGVKGKKFMIKRMREYVLSISNLPMQEQHKKIAEVFSNWKGDLEQVDDVCVIGVRV